MIITANSPTLVREGRELVARERAVMAEVDQDLDGVWTPEDEDLRGRAWRAAYRREVRAETPEAAAAARAWRGRLLRELAAVEAAWAKLAAVEAAWAKLAAVEAAWAKLAAVEAAWAKLEGAEKPR
jgi:hypothetical protein